MTTWMDLEGIMLSEISQTEIGTYRVFSDSERHMLCNITYVWNLKEGEGEEEE